MIHRFNNLSIVLLLAAALRVSAVPELPNIVVILADDFGYGSVNCYGVDPRHIRTPNIDRLAGEGIRCTDANTPDSVCTPTVENETIWGLRSKGKTHTGRVRTKGNRIMGMTRRSASRPG